MGMDLPSQCNMGMGMGVGSQILLQVLKLKSYYLASIIPG